jgi:hypothetical protein
MLIEKYITEAKSHNSLLSGTAQAQTVNVYNKMHKSLSFWMM